MRRLPLNSLCGVFIVAPPPAPQAIFDHSALNSTLYNTLLFNKDDISSPLFTTAHVAMKQCVHRIAKRKHLSSVHLTTPRTFGGKGA